MRNGVVQMSLFLLDVWRDALVVTQTVGYGTLYYAFAVFLTRCGPAHLHHHCHRRVHRLGAHRGCARRPVARSARRPRPYDHRLVGRGAAAGRAVQIGLGAAGTTSLYEAAFAVIIAWHTRAARANALLAPTVVAGFASSIFPALDRLAG
jgi:hypothetical protein